MIFFCKSARTREFLSKNENLTRLEQEIKHTYMKQTFNVRGSGLPPRTGVKGLLQVLLLACLQLRLTAEVSMEQGQIVSEDKPELEILEPADGSVVRLLEGD